MPPRETAITLGVSDMTRVRQFYSEGLGCPIDKNYGSKFVSFKLGDGSSTLALYTRDALAGDAGVAPHGSRFRGFTLSAIAGSAEHVGEMLAQAERAGGKIARAAQTGEHGGHFGYFTDPDGNLWRVASDV